MTAGLPAVQLREKDLAGRPLLALAEALRTLTARYGARLFVNDRVDVAVAVGADGVHLGGGAIPIDVARGLLPAGALVGASTHAAHEVAASTADFVFFGPVYATPAKAGYGAPQGEERFTAAVRRAAMPVLAIGGVTPATVTALRRAGAHGVAVIRAILSAPDPGAATAALLAALGG